jgi:hypothetical protein
LCSLGREFRKSSFGRGQRFESSRARKDLCAEGVPGVEHRVSET